jgi:hypothetical protein
MDQAIPHERLLTMARQVLSASRVADLLRRFPNDLQSLVSPSRSSSSSSSDSLVRPDENVMAFSAASRR